MQWSLQCILLKCPSMHMVSHMRDCSVLAGSLTQLTAEVSVSLLASAGRTIVSDWWGSIMKHYTVCMCVYAIHCLHSRCRKSTQKGRTDGWCLSVSSVVAASFSPFLTTAEKSQNTYLHETWWKVLFSYQYEDKISFFFVVVFFGWLCSFWSWGVVSLLVSRASLSGEQAITVDSSRNTC